MVSINQAIRSLFAKRARSRFRRRDTALLGLATILVISGCGNQNGLVDVSGAVTLDGEPLTTGQIKFFPEDGRPASGPIDSEGRYTLTTYEPGDGAKPGNYDVTVTARRSQGEPMYQSIEDELNGVVADNSANRSSGNGRVVWLAPPRYSNRSSSDLNVVVTPNGGQIDIQLKSRP